MAESDPKYAPWLEKVKGVHVVDLPTNILFGANEAEKKELDDWLAQFEKELLPLIQSNDKKLSATLHKSNKALLTTTFLVSNHVTLADFVFYVHIHPLMAQWTEKERIIFVNITRWFDHIQHIVARNGAPEIIKIDPDCVPFEPRKKKVEEQKQQQQQKKEGGDKKKPPVHGTEPADKKAETAENIEKKEAQGIPTKAEGTPTPPAPNVQLEEAIPEKGKGKGKGKQEERPPQEKKPQGGKKGGGGAAKEPAPQLSATEDVSRLDIRVGLIKNCRRHENADSLYIEEIDVGEEAPRQVVSGLVKFVPLDQMQNRLVLLLCNLKPTNLKSVRSQAMVLAASNEDHTQVELVDPPAGAKIGERVTFEGYNGDPEKVLKKETLDIVLPELKSNADILSYLSLYHIFAPFLPSSLYLPLYLPPPSSLFIFLIIYF
eukprot:Phypoly_transcript_07484.p1 GENE.Phypoly_transcript_07484~~Phypoly_transcript_07484.p1  ORF type:complete len:451 (+),score=136.26 Phypoly_transcript_07484:61-1353(+)